MPVEIVGDGLPLTSSQVDGLWHEVNQHTQTADEVVTVRTVDEEEMRTLNRTYRQKDRPTNVLTFSYPAIAGTTEGGQHDIALCLQVAQQEAQQRSMDLSTYTALLLVHAFLHAKGMDHELSDEEAKRTSEAEQSILEAAGFTSVSL